MLSQTKMTFAFKYGLKKYFLLQMIWQSNLPNLIVLRIGLKIIWKRTYNREKDNQKKPNLKARIDWNTF